MNPQNYYHGKSIHFGIISRQKREEYYSKKTFTTDEHVVSVEVI